MKSLRGKKMSKAQFDAEAFYGALDAERLARGYNWKQVAQQSGVSASTLTRIAQGKRPDVDSMAALLGWSGLSADAFVRANVDGKREAEPLTQMMTYLRADRNLTPEGAAALEALIKAAYENLRKA